MFLKILILLFSLFILINVRSQNLVPNGGFESTLKCPQAFGEFPVREWVNKRKMSTPDLMSTCAPANLPLNPSNEWNGLQPASGKNYAGMVAWTADKNAPSYCENIYVKLTEPLQPGIRYKIEFYVGVPYLSRWLINSIDAQVSLFDPGNDHQASDGDSTILSFDINVLRSSQKWHYVSAEFTAVGDERYLMLGTINDYTQLQATRFADRNETAHKETYDLAYLGIDEVSLTAIAPANEVKRPLASSEDLPQSAPAITLSNLNFATDSWELEQQDIPELEGFIKRLKIQPDLQILVDGFTDNQGSEEHNQELSLKRAQTVATYLVSKGIELDRITANGYGSAGAVASNESETGRRQNRRVEIRISE